jgi:hypothetical protein
MYRINSGTMFCWLWVCLAEGGVLQLAQDILLSLAWASEKIL